MCVCVCPSFRGCLFELTENNNLYLTKNQLPLASHSSDCDSGRCNKSKLKPNVSRIKHARYRMENGIIFVVRLNFKAKIDWPKDTNYSLSKGRTM